VILLNLKAMASNPLVMEMTAVPTKPHQDKKGLSLLVYGNEALEIPWALHAAMNRIWEKRIPIQAMVEKRVTALTMYLKMV
jgi:hypothetical protein